MHSNVALTAAGGNHLHVKGIADLNFTIGKLQFARPALVVKGLKSEVIIGTDTMEDYGIILNHKTKRISMVNSELEPIRAKSDYVLEPWKERFVDISCKELPGNVNILTHGPYFNEGVTNLNVKKCATIAIVNNSDTKRKIYKGDCLGYGRVLKLHEMEVNDSMTKTTIEKKTIPQNLLDSMLVSVPVAWKKAYTNLITEYSDVFALGNEVGRCGAVKQDIKLINPAIIHCSAPRPVPPNLLPVAKAYIDAMLKNNVLRESTSPYNSPIMLIKKPNASPTKPITENYRLVNDFRVANNNIIKDKFPINPLQQTLEAVARGKMWSCLDIASAFHTQELTENSKQYTAFGVPTLGVYEYCRSPMGICNSTSAYTRLVTFVFKGLESFIKYYIDDLVVVNFSGSHGEHLDELRKCFERLRKYNLKCRLSKTQLAKTTIKFLGHELHANNIRATEKTTLAIKNWPVPSNEKEIKAFLGLVNYYRKTCYAFSQISSPLNKLLRKDNPYKSGPLPLEALNAFNELKTRLCQRPCLRAPDFSRQFIVSVDSCKDGMAAVLSQMFPSPTGLKEHPVLYISRSTNDREKKYPAFKLESSGLVWALKTLKCYTSGGGEYIVRVDHKPLLGLSKGKGTVFEEVYEKLQDCLPFKIEYCKGTIINSDGLSRAVPQESKNISKISIGQNRHVDITRPPPNDPNICLLCKIKQEHVRTRKEEEVPENKYCVFSFKPTKIEHNNFAVSAISIQSMRISPEQILNLQRNDTYLKAITCYKKYGKLPDHKLLRNYVLCWAPKTIFNTDGILGVLDRQNQFKIFAPYQFRNVLLQTSHTAPLSGHLGKFKSKALISNLYFWPTLDQDLEKFIQSCETCGKCNPALNMKRLPLEPMPRPTSFNEAISMDLLKLPESNGYHYVLAITCLYTKLLTLIPLKSKDTTTVTDAFINKYICLYSIPSKLYSDMGSEFTSKIMKNVCEKLGINHVFSSSAHPQSAGAIERMNRITLTYIRKYLENNRDWTILLPKIAFSHNTTLSNSLK